MRKLLQRYWHSIAIFLAVLGPGMITANVDNDAGGIYTYAQAGAKYGYLPLWSLIPITLLLIITQEMCSRMGAVTGKGLADLIREEFGLRATFFLMVMLVFANMTNVMAEFAGIASSLEPTVSRYISVPVSAIAVGWLVIRGNYRNVEKVFLVACTLYVTYIISGILVAPNWHQALISTVRPVLMLTPDYITLIIGLIGTSIAPWMQFYLQSAVVEKGISERDYAESRIEVVVGCVFTDVVAFFIIVAAAGAIWSVHPRDITSAAEAAVALKPFGVYASLLFRAGLLNASVFAASILPLSTAYAVCEGLGFPSGVNLKFSEARVFYWLYTMLIVVGAGVVLIPHFPLVQAILVSQEINGALLPVILIYMVLLINRKDLMGEYRNSRFYNFVTWVSVVIIIGLTLTLLGVTFRGGA